MKTMQEYKAFLENVRKETGIEAIKPDDTGLVEVSVDGRYNLNLQFVESTGKVLCFVELMQLAKDAPKAVYRELLVGGLFGKDTAGGYFALESETESVVYNYYFDLNEIAGDVDEFVSTLEKILQLCDIWVARLKELQTDSGESAAAPVKDHHLIQV